MIKYGRTILPNGLRIITAPMKETKAVTVLFLIKAGSRYENKEKNGIFHFIEHMVFKGTKKRPTALDISKELDSVGASFNAFTSDEYTGFYVSATANHFNMSLDILSDIIINSQFPVLEIKKEKGVIIEEINMYNDLPQRNVVDLAKMQLFGDTPLGRSTLGEAKIVSSLSRQDFIKYIKNYYCPENMMVIISGNTDKFNWGKTVKEKLAKLSRKKKKVAKTNYSFQSEPQIVVHYKKTDQAHLVISWRTFSRFDKRRHTMKILNNIMGETMSSRLFTEVREKRGLAYYVGSSIWEFSDTGAQLSFAGLDIKRIDQSIKIILDQYKKLRDKKVSKEELNRAKENIKGKMYLGLEDSFSIADFLGEQELLFDKIKQPEQVIKDLFAVTSDDIKTLAQEIFIPKNLNLTIIGPFKKKKRFEKLIQNW